MTANETLRTSVESAICKHGGVRVAARALSVSHTYLLALRDGQKDNPTSEVLRRLGLRRVVRYEPLNDGRS